MIIILIKIILIKIKNHIKNIYWQNLKGKGSAGYINIFGSIIHNFFDGLAIGIAFATGNSH